ncbi:hypothetical protein [Wolbachia endosymbiont (group E) of Neria commutata]|uniref:hypothetical protein n=1 Tax=Wolbachia endosymbiont (group E) of Neria commutata TaxID=3066149 RepID=UPI003132DA7F
MFYKLLYEEYNLLNTSVQIYCCIKNHTSLRVEEFTLPFVTQFINEIEEFDHDFWQREYIPGILKMLPATLQNASPDVTINMLMTLKSELQNCSSYRDIIKCVFAAEQNISKFWLQINELMKSFTLSEQSLLAIKGE